MFPSRMPHTAYWICALALLVTSFTLTLLLVRPRAGAAEVAVSLGATVADHRGPIRDVPAAPPVIVTAARPEDLDGVPDLRAAMFAEPALLDLLEDATSSDPLVRNDAERVLYEYAMLPAAIDPAH